MPESRARYLVLVADSAAELEAGVNALMARETVLWLGNVAIAADKSGGPLRFFQAALVNQPLN
jgi:hypothetical protein